MIAARQSPDVLAAHRFRDLAAEQHRGDEPDLIDVVALLPAANLSPSDFGGGVEDVERVGRDAAPAQLMCRDAEVAELELFVFADEDVERREVAMKRLAAMDRVEGAQNRRDLTPNESFGLRARAGEPLTQIAVLGILHGKAVPGAQPIDDGKA